MNERELIETRIRAARIHVIGALLRSFHDLDRAEDAFQEACLRVVKCEKTG